MTTLGQFQPLRRTVRGTDYGERTAVLVPAIEIHEVRSSPGEAIPGSGNPKGPCHQPDRGPKRYRHRSRHLCPHTKLQMGMPTRHCPERQEVSVALQDQRKDWDFLERHRDLVFDNKRIQLSDSAWDKVHALAEDIWMFRRVIQKPGGNDFSRSCPWSHPVDTLIYGSWCLGGAYALVGLCATLGIPAREVGMFGHSGAEVWIDGQWCYVESIQRFPEAGGCNMTRASLAEIFLDPFRAEYGFCEEQRQVYWQTWIEWYHSAENGLWLQQNRMTHFCPQTAMALYPYWREPLFKSDDEFRYALLPAQAHMGLPELVLKQGQAFQRRFWLGSLAETRSLEATFTGGWSETDPGHHVAPHGGEWFVAVNGRVFGVRDQGGWEFCRRSAGPKAGWRHRFTIPLDALTENGWNTLAVGCPGGGAEFLCFAGAGESSLPEEPCFCAEVGK